MLFSNSSSFSAIFSYRAPGFVGSRGLSSAVGCLTFKISHASVNVRPEEEEAEREELEAEVGLAVE